VSGASGAGVSSIIDISLRRGVAPASAFLAGDCALQLSLAHLRPAFDTELPRLVVELVAGTPLGPGRARALSAATARGDVLGRSARTLPRLAVARTLLVDGARRYL